MIHPVFLRKLEMSILKGRCQNPKRTDSVESSLTALITFDSTHMCFALVGCIFFADSWFATLQGYISRFHHPIWRWCNISTMKWCSTFPVLSQPLRTSSQACFSRLTVHCLETLCCERKYVSTNGATRNLFHGLAISQKKSENHPLQMLPLSSHPLHLEILRHLKCHLQYEGHSHLGHLSLAERRTPRILNLDTLSSMF